MDFNAAVSEKFHTLIAENRRIKGQRRIANTFAQNRILCIRTESVANPPERGESFAA